MVDKDFYRENPWIKIALAVPRVEFRLVSGDGRIVLMSRFFGICEWNTMPTRDMRECLIGLSGSHNLFALSGI
jgi:hypothetical protein